MLHIVLALFIFQPIRVDEYTLDNGLKLLVYEDHFAPVVSVQIHYRVGSYNESVGLTGISHLLEHMAFKGTAKHGPHEYSRMIEGAGGIENAYTSVNRTVYHAHLGSDRYELELELEADRMQNLLIAEEEYAPEKQVVMEERRLRENDPYYMIFEQLDLIGFSYHPHRRPIIGFMADIERISRDNVFEWYRRYYNPGNAVIVIAGDVIPEQAYALVKRYFGAIVGYKVEELEFAEPPQKGERRFEYCREVQMPALAIQYHTVTISHQDVSALDVLAMILSYGMSSRFEQNLVRDKGLATTANVYHVNYKYGGNFIIFGIPQADIALADLENAIYREIDSLKTVAVLDAELRKAKNQALASAVYQQDSPAGIGMRLGSWEIEAGGWEKLNKYFEEIQEVSKEDIIRVAQTYLTKDNRTVGYLLPEEEN